jgi:hypothetical protein
MKNDNFMQLTGISRIVKAGDTGALMTTAGKMVSGYRRIHNDGVMMLDNHLHLKESQQKVIINF